MPLIFKNFLIKGPTYLYNELANSVIISAHGSKTEWKKEEVESYQSISIKSSERIPDPPYIKLTFPWEKEVQEVLQKYHQWCTAGKKLSCVLGILSVAPYVTTMFQFSRMHNIFSRSNISQKLQLAFFIASWAVFFFLRKRAQQAQDFPEWMKRTFLQKHHECWIGYYYFHGIGVTQDLAEAVKWYLKGAEQGKAPAQNTLGNCYFNETGVIKNLEEAVKWYLKAANQGYAKAQTNLGKCYLNGTGVDKNLQKALEWYHKAAEKENAIAQNMLGNCYLNGTGVDKNLEEAEKWYRKAAKQGYAEAQEALKHWKG